MEDLYNLVLERNKRETAPFLSIHESNNTLLNQIDNLQDKCGELERALFLQQEKLDIVTSENKGATAALRNETRLLEKLERLQDELNEKIKVHSEEQSNTLKLTQDLSDAKDTSKEQDASISKLEKEKEKLDRAMEHLNTELSDAKSRTKLAEQQYGGLKDMIRVLQEENDAIQKENRELEQRSIAEKEKMSTEMNQLTEMIEQLKRGAEIEKGLKKQEKKSSSWFGLASTKAAPAKEETRKFGTLSVVLPTAPKHIVSAHQSEICCVR